jgi:molybdenum cofactor cytidylyltransferase
MGQRNKLLELVDKIPLVHRVLNTVTASIVHRCVVVTGYQAERIRNSVCDFQVDIVVNPEYEKGLSTSLRTGLKCLDSEVDAALIILADMPDIEVGIINQLIQSFDPTQGREICVPVYNQRRGNPVLWSKRFYQDLCRIEGDVGGRHLIDKFRAWVHECQVDDKSIYTDIDTIDQLNVRNNPVGPG